MGQVPVYRRLVSQLALYQYCNEATFTDAVTRFDVLILDVYTRLCHYRND